MRGILSSIGSFGGKIHKSNNRTNQTELNKKQSPVDSHIINSHLTSLNSFIPSINSTAANVNPATANIIWGNSNLEVNGPNNQEAIDNLEISKQYFANSSFWRLVMKPTLTYLKTYVKLDPTLPGKFYY